MVGRRSRLGLRCVPSASARARRTGAAAGFSVTELVVVVCLLLVISAFAIPSVLRSWRVYQLNSSAVLVSNMFKACRSDAIRLNTTMRCFVVQQGGAWYVGEDTDNSGTLDANELKTAITTPNILYPAGTPAPVFADYPGVPQNVAPSVTFTSRGGVDFGPGNPPVVYAVYVGEAGEPGLGFRAVTIGPSGTTQIWIASSGGSWSKLL